MALFDTVPFRHVPSNHVSLIDPFDEMFNTIQSISDSFIRRWPMPFRRDHREIESDWSFNSLWRDPWFERSGHTFDYAQKLFDQVADKKDHQMIEENPKELLRDPDDLRDFYRRFGKNKNAKVMGASFESSSITKDGKTVTVCKESRLSPKGVIQTRVDQNLIDEQGHVDTKTWKNRHFLGRKAIGHGRNDRRAIEHDRKLKKSPSMPEQKPREKDTTIIEEETKSAEN